MSQQLDTVVIGAGVVGLAVARALALAGHEVVVLEQADRIGSGQSSRNSEVIHGGIYYPPGSLKARLCVAGRHQLYRYLDDKEISHQRIGKLVVASGVEATESLERLASNGHRCGVTDLEVLDPDRLRELEPDLAVDAALWCPASGIVDSHGLMLSLVADLEAAGGRVITRTAVTHVDPRQAGIRTQDDHYRCQQLVNAAGLDALGLLRTSGWTDLPRQFLARGHYYALTGKTPFSHLIYPLPEPGGLGVHVTLGLDGRVKFGPDVDWIEEIDYQFDDFRRDAFVRAISSYWPDVAAERLSPDMVGIRTKLVGAGEPAADFLIHQPQQHGVHGVVNLLGIESPGLTSCLAIANEVMTIFEL